MEINTLMVPRQTRRTGISKGLLEDLTLKTLYLRGEMNLVELGDKICLSPEVIDEIFQFLRKEQLIEVKGMSGGISYRIAASATGRKRAEQLLATCQYAGPAPVSLADYTGRVRSQSAQDMVLRPKTPPRLPRNGARQRHAQAPGHQHRFGHLALSPRPIGHRQDHHLRKNL